MATKRRLKLAVCFLAGGRSSTYGWWAAIMHKTPFQLPYKLLSVGSRERACSRIRDSRFHGTVKAQHENKTGFSRFIHVPLYAKRPSGIYIFTGCRRKRHWVGLVFTVFWLFFLLLGFASPIKLAKMGGRSNILNGMKSLKTFYWKTFYCSSEKE